MKESRSSRRTFLKSAAPALAGVAVAAHAGLAAASISPAPGARPQIWSREYWATQGDLKLCMFRKRLGAPKAGVSLPVLFLVHGSSVSSRSTYDLHVPGHGEYSFMDKFAGYGFDVWTMDFEGYGRSSPARGNSNVADGVENLKAAIPVVLKETGQERVDFYGESSGALRVGAYAMVEPERVGRMALGSFTYTGKGSPTLAERAKQLDFYRTHNTRPRDSSMLHSIATRDKPGLTDPAVSDAMAQAELKMGDSVPTGTYLDMVSNLPVVDPLKIQSPVLILRGQYDGIATEADLLDFFGKLTVPDRQFVILPGMAHGISAGYNRHLVWYAVKNFLETPPRQDPEASA